MDEDKFEFEKILDVRSGRRIRFGRLQRQYLVQWKGSVDPTWIDEVDLNCGTVLQEFDRDRVSKNRCKVMQSHEDLGTNQRRVVLEVACKKVEEDEQVEVRCVAIQGIEARSP